MCPKKFIYPVARRDNSVVDDYHGYKITDPYRWLEDPDSPETCDYIEAQNRLTNSYIDSYPERDVIHERFTSLSNFTKYFQPEKVGDQYVLRKTIGLQNQSDLYIQDKLESCSPRILLNINGLSKDGSMSLGSYSFSEDYSMLAYTLSEAGTDWCTIHFKDVKSGEDLPEVLSGVKFSCLSWSHDGQGVYYCRYLNFDDATGVETTSVEFQKLFYHQVGTLQDADVQIVEFSEHPQFLLTSSRVSHCGNYLIVISSLIHDLVFIGDLSEGVQNTLDFKQIITESDAIYEYVTNIGSEFYFITNKNAPNRRLVKINMNDPEECNWKEIIPENDRDVLTSAMFVNIDRLLTVYIQDVKHVVQLRILKTGDLLKTFLLGVGGVESVTGHRKHSEVFVKLVSYLNPGLIWHIDLNTMKQTVFHETKLNDFDLTRYETNQTFCKSKDGTKVPMFIVNKKDFVRDGSHAALMFGYGGFNKSVMPFFSLYFLVFMEQLEGAVAVVSCRGGGEYGDEWYNAGKLMNKQNSFNDFKAGGQYLVEHKYTNRKKLIIQGGSNGGLLVGACINQRPSLFGVAIAAVGVMDMLRYHNFTIGSAWVADYGTSEDKEQYENLRKYSPLHNVKVPAETSFQYPATLLLTADHDDRVVPLHSLKFIATLQETLRDSPKQTNPLMIRVDTRCGHGSGKPTAKQIEESVDVLCFIARSVKGEFCYCCQRVRSAHTHVDKNENEY